MRYLMLTKKKGERCRNTRRNKEPKWVNTKMEIKLDNPYRKNEDISH